MADALKLLCVLAHPDDESLGTGPLLAHYSAEGVQTHLLMATRGERGWSGPDNPGEEEVGKMREAELRCAAQELGLHEVAFLDYIDGDLDRAEPRAAIAKIAGHLRRIRPHVVITFGPDGAYGHPDHIAISQFTTAAVMAAVDPGFTLVGGAPPYRVSKLYYLIDTKTAVDCYLEIYQAIEIEVDGVMRRTVAWEDWAVTTRLDVPAHVATVRRAIMCHTSQLASLQALNRMTDEELHPVFGQQTLYRAFSIVNSGRAIESDVFEGLR